MSDIRLDDNGDIYVSNGLIELTTELDATRQYLQQRLRAIRGEWFLDLAAGLPYYEEILRKNPNPSVVDGVFKEAILTTPGVLELISFNMSINKSTRQLTVSFKARCFDGTIDFSEEFG